MKIIVAGMFKTGTKSMNAALTMLGYRVYDFLEHAYYHGREWKEIMESGDSPSLYKKMYMDVDAVVDIPIYFFWEQIHQSFPDAKIILLTRDEDGWYKSAHGQIREFNEWSIFKLATVLTPTGRAYIQHMLKSMVVGFGITMSHAWSTMKDNEMCFRLKYRQHNCYVLDKAPKDKLLVMGIQDGWEPLCKFLGVNLPNAPFPHKNKGGAAFKEAAEENPIMKKIIKEFMIFAVIFLIVISVSICLIFVL